MSGKRMIQFTVSGPTAITEKFLINFSHFAKEDNRRFFLSTKETKNRTLSVMLFCLPPKQP
jgi:hypothetical protein